MMTESDRYYIERCLDGHPDDFRHLVQRYQSMLIADLTGKLRDRGRGEEAAQETFVRAYFNMSKLKKRDSFLPWLMGIADRVARELRRKERVLLNQDDLSSIPGVATGDVQFLDLDLEGAISELPDAYRGIILLRYYGEKSCKQIAQQLEIPLGTVTKMLSRAYAMMRQSLQQGRIRRC